MAPFWWYNGSMEIFGGQHLHIFLKLVVAVVLGALIGVERRSAGKTAGMRTYALVSMGSTLFAVISIVVADRYAGRFQLDPLRVVSQIVIGIGFIGAGLIIFRNDKLLGLTTAAGLWVAGGIGVAVAYALYDVAVFATLLTLFVFFVLRQLESRLQ